MDSIVRDRIEIRNIRVAGKYGVKPDERANPQILEINVLIHADLSKPQLSDHLDDTINYSAIRNQVVTVVEQNSFRLLERLGGEICSTLLEDKRILAVEVSIAKPQKLAGATPVVTVTRRQ
jgi:dihydroneopterin aldolase